MSLSAQPTASLFIGGKPVEGQGADLPVRYALTGETIATLKEASTDQVAQACAAAKACPAGEDPPK